MLYCIYHGFVLNGYRYDIGVEKKFVDKVVEAYLRGKNEITFSGRDYSVGSTALQIYQVPNELETVQQVKSFIQNASLGNINESILAHYFENVTNDFLIDKEWGDLKEEYYNVYINDGEKKPIVIVITKKEVESLHSDLSEGKSPIWVDNRLIEFKQPQTIKIFDIAFEYLSKNRNEIKQKIKKWVSEKNAGKWNVQILQHFGKDVTSDFDIKPFSFSSSKKVEVNMNSRLENSITSDKIFISHSSKNRDIINLFTEKILQLGLGISKEKIFCTSIEGLGIKTGDDFRDKIKEELSKAKLVIIMLSEFYKKSEICQNEMGAAWVLNKKVIPIIIPPLDYSEVGALHITEHIDKIDAGNGIDNIMHTIRETLNLKLDDIRNLNCNRHYLI